MDVDHVEVKENEKVTISDTNNKLTMVIRGKTYDIVENQKNFKVMIGDRIAVLNKLENIDENKMSNQWLAKDGVVLTNCRKEDQTEFQFDMYELFKENMAGKTFYDNYNVEYEFHEYKKDGQEVCINKNYAPHCVFLLIGKTMLMIGI